MIIKCKACDGTGKIFNQTISLSLYGNKYRVCSGCNGAGEFEVKVSLDKLTECKICNGKGSVAADNTGPFGFLEKVVCSSCKGIGLVRRPIVEFGNSNTNEIQIPQSPRLTHYSYDIAVSFAGEDRAVVKEYSDSLTSKGIHVFFDEYEQTKLWGQNLYDELDEIYRKKALFCVVFISKHYAEKIWTNHERKSAQARALIENREYVLPVRLDDTELPGIPSTVFYVDLRNISMYELVQITIIRSKV